MKRCSALIFFALPVVALAAGRPSYVFKHGNHTHVGGNAPSDSKMGGDVLWVRQNGHAYVIRDSGVLAEAAAAYRDVDAYAPKVRAAEDRLRPYDARMKALETQMDAISDRFDDDSLSDATRRDLETRLHEVEEEIHQLDQQMSGLEQALERVEEAMDDREDVAERRLGAILERAIRSGRTVLQH